MTCVVGIVENGAALLAGDSAGISYRDREVYILKNAKVFRSGSYLLGYASSYRLGQILRYKTNLPEPPPDDLERFLATDFVDALRSALVANEMKDDLAAYGSVVVAVNGQLFCIGALFQVNAPAWPCVAIGSGRHAAYGALSVLEHSEKSLQERAEAALRAAQRIDPGVCEPFIFVESSTSEASASPDRAILS